MTEQPEIEETDAELDELKAEIKQYKYQMILS